METAKAAGMPKGDLPPALFGRIGRFLAQHRLSADPVHYAFAYHVLADPDGEVARAVSLITDGGVRLSRRDIESLGGSVATGAPIAAGEGGDRGGEPPENPADALIARTQVQVDGFADTVRAIHVETSDFGRDIAASAAAMSAIDLSAAIDEVARLTGAMLQRVRQTEVRLAAATRETEELRAALDEARGNARLDPLTELANRRAFDEAFARLEPGATAVVAVCDVDHFKRVNDEFGHAVGDRVLKAIGQTLVAECAGHLVARHGGEEFALLFVGLDFDEAMAIVDRARRAIAARRFRLRASDAMIGEITVSVGVASVSASERQESALARADAALYRAKRAGRNRIMAIPENGA